MINKIIRGCFAVLLTVSAPVWAGDEGLYAKAVDPNDGFLRVVSKFEGAIQIGGATQSLDHGVSDYAILSSGPQRVSWSSGSIEVALNAGEHETVVIRADGSAFVAQIQPSRAAAKADVSFVNLSNLKDVTLMVPRAKATLFENAAPYDVLTRPLRAPLSLEFAVTQAGQVIAEADQVDLVRREGVTLILLEGPRLVALRDEYVD